MAVQRLDGITAPIDDHIELVTKQLHAQLLLHQCGQTLDQFLEIHGRTVQIHRADSIARMHQRSSWGSATSSAAS